MRVLVCPDKFAGTIDAAGAAAAIAEGWLACAPDDSVTTLPLSDGGPGFLRVLAGVSERRIDVVTCDPLGRPAAGQVLLAPGQRGTRRAFIESSQACGLHLLAPHERDPRRATSFGLGLLIAAAVAAGANEVVVGLGGSATNDAGAGMLAALGAAPLDRTGKALPYGGAALASCAALGGMPRLRDATLVAATDVDSPLVGPHGASAVFGPQKGASQEDVLLLDAALTRFATVLETLPTCPPGLATLPGAGAAGGMAAAILACGGRRESGFDLVRAAIGFEDALGSSDIVITGEGSFDDQSLHGKVVSGVATAARQRGIPCLVLAGQVTADPDRAATIGVTSAYGLVDALGSVAEAMAAPAAGLRGIAGRLAAEWRGSA